MSNYADRVGYIRPNITRQLTKQLADPSLINFMSGNPAVETFPLAELADISQEIIKNSGTAMLIYGESAGRGTFREALLEYYIKPKGINNIGIDNIVVTTGSTQGFDLVGKTLLNPGDTVLVESPTFIGALSAFSLFQVNLVGVDMDDEGIILEDLEEKMIKYAPKFFYCIPTFQNPTGKTLSAERRKKVAELAAKHNVYILEDDPYGDLRIRGESVPSIKCYDVADKVILLNSFSKILAPGLRIGSIVAPGEVFSKLVLCKQSADMYTSTLCQGIAETFLRRGLLGPQIESIKLVYRKRWEAMEAGIKKYLPNNIKYVDMQGGLFTWLELPGGSSKYDPLQLLQSAISELRVVYLPTASCYVNPEEGNHTIRLSISASSSENMDIGLQRLGAFLEKHIQ